jgi:glycosyltransferase involved in cell wall biosynthesis
LWLQVAAAVKRLLPEDSFECRWVGAVENQHLRLLRLEARKLGVEDVVRFLPTVADPHPHYAAFDVFAMTSWEDPCPLVVLESMALGKVVVCFSGGGGAPEVVGDAGIMIPEFNPEWMAKAIAGLAGDPARRFRLGDAARNRVARQFVSSVQSPKIFVEIQRAAGLERSRLGAPQVTGA